MQISKLLENFKKITPPDYYIKNSVASVIKDVSGFNLNKKNISYRNGIVYIKTKQSYKSEIFINKQKIISILKEKIGKEVKINNIL